MFAFLTLPGLGAASEANGAIISITPKVGHPSERTVVSGSGFGPNEVVYLSFDGITFGKSVADATGSFIHRHPVPKDALPGPAIILAAGRQGGTRVRETFLVRTNWPGFQGGDAHTGYNQYENVLSPPNASELTEAWYFYRQFGNDASAVVANGLVYVGSIYSNQGAPFYALNARTGAEMWTSPTTGVQLSSPAVAYGTVYVGTYTGCLALDASTGTERWDFSVPGGVQGSPTVADGVVYFPDNGLVALDASTGTELWTFHAPGNDLSSPAVADGVVYFGAEKIYALEASTGVELWSFPVDDSIESSPAVSQGTVYVGLHDGLVALDAFTGAQLWKSAIGEIHLSSPAVANGLVYVKTFDGDLHALDDSTGATRWTFPTGTYSQSSVAVANGVVYAGSERQKIYALDATTGAQLWSSTCGAWGECWSPAVVDGMVYVQADSGPVYAFGLPSEPRDANTR
jgi:outer membrane protein assembly factor BamB